MKKEKNASEMLVEIKKILTNDYTELTIKRRCNKNFISNKVKVLFESLRCKI